MSGPDGMWFVRRVVPGIRLVDLSGGRQMFERFKRTAPEERTSTGAVATAERPVADDDTIEARRATYDDGTPADEGTAVHDRPAVRHDRDVDIVPGPDTLRHVRARQRAEFGGFNWGAAFFGWLVAVGVAALLVGLLAGGGAAIGLTETTTTADVTRKAEEVTLGGGIALLGALLIAYFSGGFGSGPVARLDGA